MQICPNVKFSVRVPEEIIRDAGFNVVNKEDDLFRFEFNLEPCANVQPIPGSILSYAKCLYHYEIKLYEDGTTLSRYTRKGISWIDSYYIEYIIKYYDRYIDKSSIIEAQRFVDRFTQFLYGFNIFEIYPDTDDDTKKESGENNEVM